MKRLCCLVIALSISFFAASQAAAQEYRSLVTRDGVEVMAAFDPLGPNNQVAAYIRFVNGNRYKVKITWTPFITCKGSNEKKGYGAPFTVDAGASYELRLWRSSACRVGSIKDMRVDMEVRRADMYGQ